MAQRQTKSARSDTLKRHRTRCAYARVREWDGLSATDKRTLATRAKGLPVVARTQGITVAVATLMRERQPQVRIAAIVAGWILRDMAQLAGFSLVPEDLRAGDDPTVEQFLHVCVEAPRRDFLTIQGEALALLEQVKLMSDALFGSSAEDGS